MRVEENMSRVCSVFFIIDSLVAYLRSWESVCVPAARLLLIVVLAAVSYSEYSGTSGSSVDSRLFEFDTHLL